MSQHDSAAYTLLGPEEVLLTTEQAAAYFCVSPSTLAYWRTVGEGPPYARLGIRTIRYRRSEVLAYGATVQPSNQR